MAPTALRYCARYCEENVWHLAQEPALLHRERIVAIVSGGAGACLLWDQRAGGGLDAAVWWDYHVILLVREGDWRVYDLDTALPCPVEATTYLRRTFRRARALPDLFRPRFALFRGDEYVANFSSDRSHMRDGEGRWLSPPPDWPPIDGETGEPFPDVVAGLMHGSSWLTLAALEARLASGERHEDQDPGPHSPRQ